jgi:hypothetical protein
MDKESKAGKKLWQKPELTVLVRNKPEEVVLGGCKQPDSPGSSVNDQVNSCHDIPCASCDNIIGS